MTKTPALRINKLSFVGRNIEPAELDFPRALSFIYGASNTGKSFAVKAIDFMFGASRELPAIVERRPYDSIHLYLQIGEAERVKLERAIVGGDFKHHSTDGTARTLAARHSRDNNTNLSNYLLGCLRVTGKEVAKDKSGTKKPLSFRDIARFCITDETSIQSETSPVESGDVTLAPMERNTFKFLLTGEDDSALITQEKPKDFRMGKMAQLRIYEEMISQIDTEISEDYPDVEQLDKLGEDAADELKDIEQDIVAARASARSALEQKRSLAKGIGADQQRVNDIAISLENFEQLQSVYESDIARLEAIEEVGFLLGMDANRVCPVCGAPPEAQLHDHSLTDIQDARGAAEIEIAKIKLHQSELASTIAGTQDELNATEVRLLQNQGALETIEAELSASSPSAGDQQRRFSELIPRRDRINRGLELLTRRAALEKQRVRIEKSKRGKPTSNFQPGLSTNTAQEFADEVAVVLTAWGFPGERRVVFDLQTQDLIIDGKHRKDNGKGVRAITHAAFKVALLTYCRARELPHPGFVVLDSPLITYRDPITSRLGALSPDEQVLLKSDLKERFFQHLSSLGTRGQFILFDNADPPANGVSYAHVEAFTNDSSQGRQGLFKVTSTQ
jgi:hypothetical protein